MSVANCLNINRYVRAAVAEAKADLSRFPHQPGAEDAEKEYLSSTAHLKLAYALERLPMTQFARSEWNVLWFAFFTLVGFWIGGWCGALVIAAYFFSNALTFFLLGVAGFQLSAALNEKADGLVLSVPIIMGIGYLSWGGFCVWALISAGAESVPLL